MKATVELVTPDVAAKWLTTSKGNRTIRQHAVVAYADAMARGEWHVNDAGIGFDAEGHLINGHHRLMAVVSAGCSVKMLVCRNLEREAIGTIDCGRPRTLGDRLSLFRPKTTYRHNVVAHVRTCARLLLGIRPEVVSIRDFDRWISPFKAGIDWALEALARDHVLRKSPFSGALAFAHRTDPPKIAEFGERVCSGANLAPDSPELALRLYASNSSLVNIGGDRPLAVARRTLNCALAFLEGRERRMVKDGIGGLIHFRTVYDTPSIARLAQPWTERTHDETSETQWISAEEAAARLGVHATTARAMAANGELVAEKKGNVWA